MNGILVLTLCIIAISIVRLILPHVWQKPPVKLEIAYWADTLIMNQEQEVSSTDFSSNKPYYHRKEMASTQQSWATAMDVKQPTIWKPKHVSSVDINTVDSLDLDALPGISKSLAGRIIKYRNRLGGFQSSAQISEIYYIPEYAVDSLLKYSFGYGEKLKKIAINEVSDSFLSQHPYLNKSIARTIVSYRNKHGHFRDCGSLNAINRLDKQVIDKLCPYLDFSSRE